MNGCCYKCDLKALEIILGGKVSSTDKLDIEEIVDRTDMFLDAVDEYLKVEGEVKRRRTIMLKNGLGTDSNSRIGTMVRRIG